MSITLFHCPHCDTYSLDATVRLYVSAMLDPKRGMLRVGDDTSLPEGYSIPLEDIVGDLCLCPKCDGPTELVILDECPHQWRDWQIDQWGEAYCICQFCGERRKGKVLYVTEFSE